MGKKKGTQSAAKAVGQAQVTTANVLGRENTASADSESEEKAAEMSEGNKPDAKADDAQAHTPTARHTGIHEHADEMKQVKEEGNDVDARLTEKEEESGSSTVLAAFVGGLALVIFSRTRYIGVPGGDSGELMAMACQRGVAHPPGYPLLTMLGSGWLSICPDLFGAPAAKLSLLAAVLGASSAAILALAARKISSFWGGVFGGGMFACSSTVWKFSTQYEVFALNNLFVSALLFLTIKYFADKSWWIPYAGALLCGLALTNQHTVVLYELPLIIAVLAASKGALLRPYPFLALVALFVLGLTPYIYLPLAGKLK
jgi:hypothetical protein